MTGIMLRMLIGGFLIAHGMLHWRFDLSRSWLLASAKLRESVSIRSFATLLGVLTAIEFVTTGFGVLGFPYLSDWWRMLAIVSSAISLLLLILAWHPWLTLGVFIDIGILAALLWANFPAEAVVSS